MAMNATNMDPAVSLVLQCSAMRRQLLRTQVRKISASAQRYSMQITTIKATAVSCQRLREKVADGQRGVIVASALAEVVEIAIRGGRHGCCCDARATSDVARRCPGSAARVDLLLNRGCDVADAGSERREGREVVVVVVVVEVVAAVVV